MAVQVTTLKREEIVSQSRFTATVREQQRIELSFKVPGTVALLLQVPGLEGKPRDVHEGDEVTADSGPPVGPARRFRLSAAAGNGPRSTWPRPRPSRRATEATVTAVRANFERMKALRERGSVAQQAFDDVLARRDSADAELDGSRREVSAADHRPATGRRRLEELLASVADRQGHRFPQVRGKRRARPGRAAGLRRSWTSATVRVAFGVPDTKVNQFSAGQTMTVMADAFPGQRFVGRVSKILPGGRPAHAELRGGSDDRPALAACGPAWSSR